ncbi:hypothetical protein [Pedobacter caeni]|uniref:Uncharacterized protein n=1 Tax=Pedobacter caeni TaxID=288992 RepID=A0A1M5AT78_9SPHI|nr:hypothetical protein [Pedobacter caeni]SHF33433.1 hypothetical protein SAMN04488522_102878 [Pedobacter caeni]
MIRVNRNHLYLKTLPVSSILCPLCGASGKMEMAFYQVQIETDNIHNTRKITASVSCSNCNKDIPNIRWNNGLDEFYRTEKKQIKVITSFKIGTKGKVLLWIAGIFFGAIFILLAVLYIYGHMKSK